MKKVMGKIEKIVSSMQRSEMGEMKKIYKNSRFVAFGLECLCLLLGEEPIEKSINKILADPNLMMKMKSPAILNERNVRVQQKWDSEHESLEKELKEKSYTTETSKIIIDWIKVVIEYWEISDQHLMLNGKYKTHKAKYEDSLKEQARIEAALEDLKQKTLAINQNFFKLFVQK